MNCNEFVEIVLCCGEFGINGGEFLKIFDGFNVVFVFVFVYMFFSVEMISFGIMRKGSVKEKMVV